MNKSEATYTGWTAQIVTYAMRTTVALGVPAYLSLRMGISSSVKVPGNPFLTAAIVVISTPPAVVFGLGAVEGTARSCAALVKYIFGRAEKNGHWKELCKELGTTNGLCRLALSPYSAYRYTFFEERVQSISPTDTVLQKTAEGKFAWEPANIAYPQIQADPISYERGKPVRVFDVGSYRDLKNEYFVYRAPIAFGKGLWQLMHIAFDGLCWMGRQVLWAGHKTWEAVCYIGNKTATAVNAVWKACEPLRLFLKKVVRTVVWDIMVMKVIWPTIKFVGRVIESIWKNIVLPTIKFVGRVITFVWEKIVWPVFKFVGRVVEFLWEKVVWPVLKFVGTIVATVIAFAFSLIGWATQQFFKRGK